MWLVFFQYVVLQIYPAHVVKLLISVTLYLTVAVTLAHRLVNVMLIMSSWMVSALWRRVSEYYKNINSQSFTAL